MSPHNLAWAIITLSLLVPLVSTTEELLSSYIIQGGGVSFCNLSSLHRRGQGGGGAVEIPHSQITLQQPGSCVQGYKCAESLGTAH